MGGVSDKYVARQAILDREQQTFAYELLYRSGLDNFYTGTSPEQSTSQIIYQNHIMGSIDELCLSKLAFINFDEKSLLSKLPLFLDKKIVVIEILEDVNITPEIIKEVGELYKKGYKIALDDYDFSPKWKPLFPYVSFIKVDREDISVKKISSLTASSYVKEHKVKILVERVENQQQFNELVDIGVDLFQGYFFHKPEIQSGAFIEPMKLNLLQLFSQTCRPHIDFDSISEIISHDVGLINGVLKLVNISSEANRVEITSVKQAVTFLGTDKIKQYVAIIAMTNLSCDSAGELLTESLIRAKMMELISLYKPFLDIQPYAFITGLLSNVDVILKCPMSKVIENLSLSPQIEQALLNNQGKLYEALQLATYFERLPNNITSVDEMSGHVIADENLIDDYQNALRWYKSIYE